LVDITPHTTEEWIERISKHELPALCSTIREIEKLSKDDISSLATLGQTVLHDHALTSAILKVANSASYMGRNPVTTVSRASVILGLTTIKNICLTAKLLNSLLRNRKLTPRVYERLLKLMAQSFHAGMIARLMMQSYDDDIQEEAFIAALLNRFGESAFWSMGGALTVELDELLRKRKINQAGTASAVVRQKIGTTFEEMSLGLATSWNLGQVLISSLEDPELRTPELRSVSLAVKLSDTLADPNHRIAHLDQIYVEMSALIKVDKKHIPLMVEECTEQTTELLHSYGVGMLNRYLNHDASKHAVSIKEPVHEEESSQSLQLKILRELAFLPNEKADFNIVVQTAMEGMHRGIKMQRTLVLLKTRDQHKVIPRFISAAGYEEIKRRFRVDISGELNIFSHVLNTQLPVWVSDMRDPQWSSLTFPVRHIVDGHGFFLAPILWGKKCVGIFYADRDSKSAHLSQSQELSQEDYMAFTLFAQQANLCLSQIIKGK